MKQSDIHVRRAPAEPLQERRREPGQDGLRCTDPEAACADLRIKAYRRGDHAANPGKDVRDGLTKMQGARRRNDAPGGPQEQRVVQQAAKPSQDWSLRVTEVYRRDAAGWELVHRHADPLVHRITIDQASVLAKGSENKGLENE